MKTYNIYKHPLGDIKAVKVGWSWPAFFFTWIWAFVKGLYVVGVILLIIDMIEFLITSLIFPVSFISLSWSLILGNPDLFLNTPFIEFIFSIFYIDLIIHFLVGSMANKWLEKNLIKKGYEFVKDVNAETPEGALAIFAKTPRLIVESDISTGEDIYTKEESEAETNKSIGIQEILLFLGIFLVLLFIIWLISR